MHMTSPPAGNPNGQVLVAGQNNQWAQLTPLQMHNSIGSYHAGSTHMQSPADIDAEIRSTPGEFHLGAWNKLQEMNEYLRRKLNYVLENSHDDTPTEAHGVLTQIRLTDDLIEWYCAEHEIPRRKETGE